MEGAGPTVFERIEQKLSGMGVRIDNADINEALKQVEARLSDDPADMESKLARLELKVVELARMLDAALEAGNGSVLRVVAPEVDKPAPEVDKPAPGADKPAPGADKPAQAAAKQGARKIKKLVQNPATGVIEEQEVEDDPSDHFIVADGHGRFTAKDMPQHKKSVFIAATDDEPVKK